MGTQRRWLVIKINENRSGIQFILNIVFENIFALGIKPVFYKDVTDNTDIQSIDLEVIL